MTRPLLLDLCVTCGKPFEWWQRITPGPRHGACNPDLAQAERDRIFGSRP